MVKIFFIFLSAVILTETELLESITRLMNSEKYDISVDRKMTRRWNRKRKNPFWHQFHIDQTKK